jgi:hypothetical protein
MSLFSKYLIGFLLNFRISLNDVCLHVENINSDSKILPEYSCLLISPTNLWHQNPEEFRTDNTLEKTIFAFQVLTFFGYFNKCRYYY